MDPASAAPITMPKAMPRCRSGKAVLAIARPIGTVAPPPRACTTRTPTIHSRLEETATSAVPTVNTIRPAWYTRA